MCTYSPKSPTSSDPFVRSTWCHWSMKYFVHLQLQMERNTTPIGWVVPRFRRLSYRLSISLLNRPQISTRWECSSWKWCSKYSLLDSSDSIGTTTWAEGRRLYRGRKHAGLRLWVWPQTRKWTDGWFEYRTPKCWSKTAIRRNTQYAARRFAPIFRWSCLSYDRLKKLGTWGLSEQHKILFLLICCMRSGPLSELGCWMFRCWASRRSRQLFTVCPC